MKKKSYSALLLLFISFASLAQPNASGFRHADHSTHQYQSNYADTAESPDEFFRSAVRELKP
ncbi:hypothetical protein [Rosenbergiella australiborealis]|uniref:Uncharacterized protein n=1 Tax=Rosenbergiella australiborealis TaxID=1544696 RepID=A0ABS5T8P2_9GAMM|nr:hypothetical protein [Rosenbergiella australiborealis]MBT0727802.1 hypothetical protein [Rosenbergiella australiborealis]